MAWSIAQQINLIGQDTGGVLLHLVQDLPPIIPQDQVGAVTLTHFSKSMNFNTW